MELSWSHDLEHEFDMLTRVDSGYFFGFFFLILSFNTELIGIFIS
jgi:hypothetical protein